jgi:hypothetical protein
MTVPRVFVSRAAVLGPAESGIAAQWSAALEGLGLAPVELTREEYLVPPWPQLRALVRSCQGVVVLGFRERPTPWSHVEAGLGIMAGLPVLVADEGAAEGVFSPDVWGDEVRGVSLGIWERAEPRAEPALQDWLSSVRSRR